MHYNKSHVQTSRRTAYQVPLRSQSSSGYLINLDFKDPQTGQAKANILSLQAHTSPLIDSPQQGDL